MVMSGGAFLSELVIQPAATGFGKTTIPQTNSFVGTIALGEKGCRLIFKRPELKTMLV
jgi:hypothetical protein